MAKKKSELPTSFPHPIEVGSVVVKIYKTTNRGKDVFYISHFAAGTRTQRMFKDFYDAEREAKKIGGFHNRGEIAMLELTGEDCTHYQASLEALKPTGVQLLHAAKEFAIAWQLSEGAVIEACREYKKRNLHKLPSIMVPDAVEKMIEAKRKEGLSADYLRVTEIYLGKFKGHFKSELREVSSPMISAFLRKMEDVSPRSKNNIRQTLGVFFAYCKERGWLPKDHEGISCVPKFKEAPSEIGIFAPWEMNVFLRYAKPQIMPFLMVGAFAGLRSAEVLRLDWKEVHLKDRFIEVKAIKAKTGSRRLVPILDNLATWFEKQEKKEGNVLVVDNLAKEIEWLVEDSNAGLVRDGWHANPESKKVPTIEWKKNALRHSFISYRVAAIQNVNQVALECGNTPAIIFKHYRELVRPAQATEWFAIKPSRENAIVALPEAKAAA